MFPHLFNTISTNRFFKTCEAARSRCGAAAIPGRRPSVRRAFSGLVSARTHPRWDEPFTVDRPCRDARRRGLDVLSPWKLRRAPGAEEGYIFRTVAFFLVGCASLPRTDGSWYRSSGQLREISRAQGAESSTPDNPSSLRSAQRLTGSCRCLLRGTHQVYNSFVFSQGSGTGESRFFKKMADRRGAERDALEPDAPLVDAAHREKAVSPRRITSGTAGPFRRRGEPHRRPRRPRAGDPVPGAGGRRAGECAAGRPPCPRRPGSPGCGTVRR